MEHETADAQRSIWTRLTGRREKWKTESARKSARFFVVRLIRWLRKWGARRRILANSRLPGPAPVPPIWPLPRCAEGPSEEEIRMRFAKPNLWHFDFSFEGGLQFSSRHAQPVPYLHREDALKRFCHFMPWLLQATGGNLEGKRVLDIGCNSGFWSIQCALLGAREVVGFDARRELVDEASFIREVVGCGNVQFRVLDFWDMNPETMGGSFDVVLNLGILYHLPDPLEALKRTRQMANGYIILDTMLVRSEDSIIRIDWEKPNDINQAATAGIVAWPSRSGVELMLKHIGLSRYLEIPIRTMEVPSSYAAGDRASWLIDGSRVHIMR